MANGTIKKKNLIISTKEYTVEFEANSYVQPFTSKYIGSLITNQDIIDYGTPLYGMSLKSGLCIAPVSIGVDQHSVSAVNAVTGSGSILIYFVK